MPYQSKSIEEFWKKWHISLSTWFKDYLYIPLGGNRVKIYRWYLNLFVVFIVSGLWHGANWTFIFWGALHGFYLVFGLLTKSSRSVLAKFLYIDRLPLISTLTTFILVWFAWIFFRASSISSAFLIIKNISLGLPRLPHTISETLQNFINNGITKLDLLICLTLIVFLELIHYFQKKIDILKIFSESPVYIRWTIYYALILIILFFGVFDHSQFIYFQF